MAFVEGGRARAPDTLHVSPPRGLLVEGIVTICSASSSRTRRVSRCGGATFLRREFAPLLEKTGLRCRFHDLRHTAASLALMEGVPPHVVSRMCGHSRVSVLMDLYAHVLPGQGREAAAKMNALFRAHPLGLCGPLSDGRYGPLQEDNG